MTRSQELLIRAVHDAKATAKQLTANKQETRATTLLVACDLIISAAFLFSTTDQDCDRATEEIMLAIAHAIREEQ